MAEYPEEVKPIEVEEEDELTPGYKAPKQVDLKTLQELDADDEALVKYKQALLGNTDAVGPVDDPRRVVVQAMSMCFEERPDFRIDLTGDLAKLKDIPLIIKEGVSYRIKIEFRIQHEIVSGLRYHHAISRKGITADKSSYMVGSYGPKAEVHSWQSPEEEAPRGILARGTYKVKCKFIDDDKNVHLQWEWCFDIKKDWES